MKKTAEENIQIADIIGNALGVSFHNEEFSLDEWGDVDDWCELSHDMLILLECENSQKHPNTNVMKLYPWLEKYPKVHVILIHYFFPENKAPKNRIGLCDFIAGKMMNEFGVRFEYVQLNCGRDLIGKHLNKVEEHLIPALIGSNKRILKK